jgi:hypothetical protein
MTDPDLTYIGHVNEDGQISLPKRMRAELAATFRGKDIEVRVRRKRKRTSDPQRRYYFGVIVEAITYAIREADPETGWNREMVHEVLKERFLPRVREWREYVNHETGEAIREPMTTTKLTTTEREMYHDHCRKFAAELFGITVPLPNEQAELFNIDQLAI